MPDSLCVPGAGAKCSSAHAVIADSSTAERGAAASPEANRGAPPGAVTNNHDAGDTATPSASAVTAAGAAKGSFERM